MKTSYCGICTVETKVVDEVNLVGFIQLLKLAQDHTRSVTSKFGQSKTRWACSDLGSKTGGLVHCVDHKRGCDGCDDSDRRSLVYSNA